MEQQATKERDRIIVAIQKACEHVERMLIAKHAGDGVVDPVRTFSKSDPIERLLRISDKLSKLQAVGIIGASSDSDINKDANEDVISDLIGYLIFLRIAQEE